MGKKSESGKSGTAIATSPEPKKKTAEPAEPTIVTPAEPAGTTNGATAKAPPKKKAAPKTTAKRAVPIKISTEDIALRAYFISEDRQRTGTHGDAHSDWVEAERQLKAEHRKAKRKTSAPKKAAKAA